MKKKIVGFAVVALAGVMIVREIALRQAFKMMVGRKNSKLGKKMMADNTTCRRPYYEEWLSTVEVKNVSVVSHDGLKLYGHYITIPDAKRNVLLMHGWRGTWKDLVGPAKEFIKEKCNVLIVEERAQGNSEGKYMGFGVMESLDCLAERCCEV